MSHNQTDDDEYCLRQWQRIGRIWDDGDYNADEIHLAFNSEAFRKRDGLLSLIDDMASGDSLSQSNAAMLERAKTLSGKLTHFADTMETLIDTPGFTVGPFWAVIGSLLKSALPYDNLLGNIVDQLGRYAGELNFLSEYRDTTVPGGRLNVVLMDIFVSFSEWAANITKSIRNNDFVNHPDHAFRMLDKAFEENFSQVKNFIASRKETVARNVERINLSSPQNKLPTLVMSPSADILLKMKLLEVSGLPSDQNSHDMHINPCHNLPPKNEIFNGRDAIMQELRERLDHEDSKPKLRSLALWGTGGIGKTQIALAYARERQEKGVPVVLWINCETDIVRAQSFTQAAIRIGIKDADKRTNDENQRSVMVRLEQTKTPWLVVFDNVAIDITEDEDENPDESKQTLKDYWLVGDYGSVVVTSRFKSVSFGPADSHIEVLKFDRKEGEAFLNYVLSKKSHRLPDPDTEESKAAQELSALLGGLPLALYLMAGQIFRRGVKVQAFVKLYENHHKKLHKMSKRQDPNLYYRHSLDTCWTITFDALANDENALSLLGSVCFLDADAIPDGLFNFSSDRPLPPQLKFCHDDWSYSEAIDHMLDVSILRKDPGGDMSVHRLIQEQYLDRMGQEKRYDFFVATSKLLVEAFPRQDEGEDLRERAEYCAAYVKHGVALALRFREFGFKAREDGNFLDFAELMSNCAWYLFEIEDWNQCMKIIGIALTACEKEDLWYAHLCATAASLEAERAHCLIARPYFDKSIEIRERMLPPIHRELANIYASLANMLLTERRTPDAPLEAIKLYEKAIDIDLRLPKGPKLGGYLFIRYINLGFAQRCQGLYQKALDTMEESRRWAIERYGPDSGAASAHWQADVDYNEGSVYYQMKEFKTARQLYNRALKVYCGENEDGAAATATEFKLACVDLREGKIHEAIRKLEKNKLKCEIREVLKQDKGDTARVVRRLAEAYELDGNHTEARQCLADAERMRREIQGSRFDELPDSESSYDMLVSMNWW